LKLTFIALGVLASHFARAGAIDVSVNGVMNWESHTLGTPEGDFHYYESRTIAFSNASGHEAVRYDWLDVDFRETGFSYELYSRGNHGGYSPWYRSAWFFGHGTINSTFTVTEPGMYRISANSRHDEYWESRPYLHRMLRPDGSPVFSHSTVGTFGETVYLSAGTYSTELTYDSIAEPSVYGTSQYMRFRYSVQAVPEPGTMLVLGAGLAWLSRKRVR